MKTANRKLAIVLAVLMLISLLPVSALAVGEADIVSYNLGSCPVPVGSDAALLESGEIGDVFDENGDYTIELEGDAFFPYQVQFAWGEETMEYWFMTPTDTVTVAGHTFRVHSEQYDEESLTRLGVKIGDTYVPAYPEAKDFAPKMLLRSMMPLREKRLTLDLRGYLPAELKNTSISTIVAGLKESYTDAAFDDSNETYHISEDVAVYTRWYYYDSDGNYFSDNDNYTVYTGGPIDLNSRYGGTSTLELIVGTVDQLNLDNLRYIVTVQTSSEDDMFSADVYTDAEQREQIKVFDTYSYKNPSDGKTTLYLQIDKTKWDGQTPIVAGLSLNDAFAGLTVRAFEGAYDSVAEIDESKEITDKILNQNELATTGGYPISIDYRNRTEVTFVISRGDDSLGAFPMIIYPTLSGLSVSVSGIFSNKVNISNGWSTTFDSSSGARTWTTKLDYGFSASGTYKFALNMHNPDPEATNENNGLAYVKKAVVGTDLNNGTDIKEQLFSSGYNGGGYETSGFNTGITFTVCDINDEITKLMVVATESDEPSQTTLSDDTYFRVNGAYKASEGTGYAGSYSSYRMPSDADAYFYNGYQTVFLLDQGGPVTATTILPTFTTLNNARILAGLDKTGGTEIKSGETAIPFESGKVVQYSAASESNEHLKNYWVTFLTQQSGPKLFVNATNDEDRMVEVGEEKIPQREVILTESYGNHHDVFFANIGDEAIAGLYVKLEDAEGVKLDDFWTIGATTTLSPFTTTYKQDAEGHSVYYGELANVAKIRLQPIAEGYAGSVSGTLTIGYTGNGDQQGEEVKIKLTGFAGTLRIVTGEETEDENVFKIADAVKYVPYSTLIQTNWMYGDDNVTFSVSDGELPDGLSLRPKTGELYGIPTKEGTYTFTLKATAKYDSVLNSNGLEFSDERKFTLTIKENTNENVDAATDEGYSVWTAATDEHPKVTSQELIDHIVTTYKDLDFVSEGEFEKFVAFYADGKKLVEGTDYQSEEGSTIITILESTLQTLDTGTHTIAMEFRDDGAGTETSYSPLHRTSRNYESTTSGDSGGGYAPAPAPSSPAEPEKTEPKPVDTTDPNAPVELATKIEGNTAKVDLLSVDKESQLANSTNEDVVIDLTAANDVETIVIPASVLEKLAAEFDDSAVKPNNLKILLPKGKLSLDAAAVQAIASQAGGKDVRMKIQFITYDDLSEAQQAQVSREKFFGGVRITMDTEDGAITSFGGGRITISLPFDLPAGQRARDFTVFYIAPDGSTYCHASTVSGAQMNFRIAHLSEYGILYAPVTDFNDVKDLDWFASFVDYAARCGLMIGVSDDSFAPQQELTRAMVAQILYNMGGEGAKTEAQTFTDVKSDDWFADAVNWAAEVGIVHGVAEGIFAPNDIITREQLAVMLYNYAVYKGYNVSNVKSFQSFADAADVSAWAETALRWAVGEELINGMENNTLVPKLGATRAQAAKILTYFFESYEP